MREPEPGGFRLLAPKRSRKDPVTGKGKMENGRDEKGGGGRKLQRIIKGVLGVHKRLYSDFSPSPPAQPPQNKVFPAPWKGEESGCLPGSPSCHLLRTEFLSPPPTRKRHKCPASVVQRVKTDRPEGPLTCLEGKRAIETSGGGFPNRGARNVCFFVGSMMDRAGGRFSDAGLALSWDTPLGI